MESLSCLVGRRIHWFIDFSNVCTLKWPTTCYFVKRFIFEMTTIILLKQFYTVLTMFVVPFLFWGLQPLLPPCSSAYKKVWIDHVSMCNHRVLFFSRDESNGFDSFLALEQSEDMLVDEIIKVIRIVVIIIIRRKGFEPRTNISWLKKIIWVIGVLRRTVVSDWRFNNLCGSHLQSQVVVLVSWKFKNPAYQFKNPAHQENSKTLLTRVFEFLTD